MSACRPRASAGRPAGPARAGHRGASARSRRSRGFTLIELMIVVAIVGVAAALATFALRDPTEATLDQEGERLAALLEAARAESRAAGVPVWWTPGTTQGVASDGSVASADFRFDGLPPTLKLPARWLDPRTAAEAPGQLRLLLGPEPLIGAQQVVLKLGDRRVVVATDGLGPFSSHPAAAAVP